MKTLVILMCATLAFASCSKNQFEQKDPTVMALETQAGIRFNLDGTFDQNCATWPDAGCDRYFYPENIGNPDWELHLVAYGRYICVNDEFVDTWGTYDENGDTITPPNTVIPNVIAWP